MRDATRVDVRAGLQSKVGQGYKFSSVGSRFKRQLGELMEALHRMEPHYIRCIKPNSFNRSADPSHIIECSDTRCRGFMHVYAHQPWPGLLLHFATPSHASCIILSSLDGVRLLVCLGVAFGKCLTS